MTDHTFPPKIGASIIKVMESVGKLAKEEKNLHGNYKFVSVDAFLEAVQPACAAAGLIIIQDEESFEAKEGWLMLTFRFCLAHADGEMWDHQPKRSIMVSSKMGAQAFGAAQSYALKQFMRSLFQIPTGDKDDADFHEQTKLPDAQQKAIAEINARNAKEKAERDALNAATLAARARMAAEGDETPTEEDSGSEGRETRVTYLKAALTALGSEIQACEDQGTIDALMANEISYHVGKTLYHTSVSKVLSDARELGSLDGWLDRINELLSQQADGAFVNSGGRHEGADA